MKEIWQSILDFIFLKNYLVAFFIFLFQKHFFLEEA